MSKRKAYQQQMAVAAALDLAQEAKSSGCGRSAQALHSQEIREQVK